MDEHKDQIKVDDELVFYRDKVVLMVNKPKDYVSANKDGLHKTVFELIEEPIFLCCPFSNDILTGVLINSPRLYAFVRSRMRLYVHLYYNTVRLYRI